MRKHILGLLVLALVPGLAWAQGSGSYRGHGYVFVAPGGSTVNGHTAGILHFGGGGEGFIYKGFAIAGELGYLAPTRSLGDGIGVLSANGSYHFKKEDSERKLVPFITGGYSLGFREATANMFNFGGGVNYWFRERTALRVEFRDHVWTGSTVHYWQFRFGLTLR
jgi:hypothetical protein